MQISRTQVVAWIMTVVGLLGLLGIDLPADAIEKLLSSISDDSIELFMVVSGGIMVWFRKITESPAAQGLKGLLFKDGGS
jgi:hypothetical protein